MEYVQVKGDRYFKIQNSDGLRPFFMSIVSDSNHWMFMSSNGGITAGRKNSEFALFPYYTDDKITESNEITGGKTIFRITKNGKTHVWEPFCDNYTGVYRYTRNLYKSEYGNKVIFEEFNHDLNLHFQRHWNTSDAFGFVCKSVLFNEADSEVHCTLLDGLQNIMPHGVNSALQQASSNLVDAYKKSELLSDSGLGIFALSAIIVDRAEPSESLKANVVWSHGLENPTHLLSSLQLQTFRKNGTVVQEEDVRAEKGAYFAVSEIILPVKGEKEWFFVADVDKSTAQVINLSEQLKNDGQIAEKVFADVAKGTKELLKLATAADGKQLVADYRRNSRHYSNVLFNMMRGGIFDDNYTIEKQDFTSYLAKANNTVFDTSQAVLSALTDKFNVDALKRLAHDSIDKDFARLCFEYLPLKFSRRHGDPSRPWNKFSINTKSDDGAKILDYQGNWRDIFQNWEALVHSYPEFIDGMMHKFLNATTFDGYNPYRVTKDGFDWETIEPDDPWSYIGYWGDHQIIYLLKFLEFYEKYSPNSLSRYFDKHLFVYANVPYRIKSYQDILKNPKDSIELDRELEEHIHRKRAKIGADGALLEDVNGTIYKVNLTEKLLATLLAKMSNFIPEGGIWMNTQRPEWNDANNALVGNGVSMVTLYYLRRFMHFLKGVLENASAEKVAVSKELQTFFHSTLTTLQNTRQLLAAELTNEGRKTILDALASAGSTYRHTIYANGFTGEKIEIAKTDMVSFLNVALQFLEHSIDANKRKDNLYHAYNLMTVENDKEISISHLPEMLEGQVALLSAGYISSKESLAVLNALKNSSLFRSDQYSYILYPNKQLPRFVDKNSIPKERAKTSELIKLLEQQGNTAIIEKDSNGGYHFNGNFNNADSLQKALSQLPKAEYGELVVKETPLLLAIFEEVFDHRSFTGRSGTFYGYEGLGSIYWHMVSKLLLSVQETALRAIENKEDQAVIGGLLDHYYEINEGIGVHKSPELYGAFPTDPYSHTPGGKGAQQPGMTGQVKEDVLCRFGELGVFISGGCLQFNACLLRKEEFLTAPALFEYTNVQGQEKTIQLLKGSLAFTFCQVPIIYSLNDTEGCTVHYSDGQQMGSPSLVLHPLTSGKLFKRTGEIEKIIVQIKK